jgi:glycosyltransferase involved in cell wall biosynthesis
MLDGIGIVAIGRNEGERLVRCLESAPAGTPFVYVDSGSTDGSIGEASRRGAEVVTLDVSRPFTAARARNAGLKRLREQFPSARFVQFVDGDCGIAPGWLEAALDALRSTPGAAAVCGRRREARPERSVYNRLCDMEWDTPVGDAEACGGDAMFRIDPLEAVGGYDDALIAGEEPELCARLRGRGWRILRIAPDMTVHDAAITRFRQWWRRAVRAGHGYAEVGARHPPMWRRNLRSALVWGLVLPALALGSAAVTGGAGLALLAVYPALWARTAIKRRARGDHPRDAAVYAAFCLVAKPAELAGATMFYWNQLRRRRTGLIEYK